MPYLGSAADNFHYMDEIETYHHGSYDALELAVAACKRIVDEYLTSAYTPADLTSATLNRPNVKAAASRCVRRVVNRY